MGSAGSAPVVEVEALEKHYRVGFLRKVVEAVRGVSFQVREGEIVGLVGPNGSGKTSTIKVLMGLCAPTRGAARIDGLDSRVAKARQRVGFLPENPYVYPYLSPREYVDLCARLSGLDKTAGGRAKKVQKALERTGVAHAADRPVRGFSKGMLQRTGLAAALVADPALLVLDEPMSGLDPLGRREVRDLIAEERRAGRTVLFSSHVLSDVEALCDRVIIVFSGKIEREGLVRDLVRSAATLTEVTFRNVSEAAKAAILRSTKKAQEQKDQEESEVTVLRALGDEVAFEVKGDDGVDRALRAALENGARLISAVPRKDSLEDLFVRQALRSQVASE